MMSCPARLVPSANVVHVHEAQAGTTHKAGLNFGSDSRPVGDLALRDQQIYLNMMQILYVAALPFHLSDSH